MNYKYFSNTFTVGDVGGFRRLLTRHTTSENQFVILITNAYERLFWTSSALLEPTATRFPRNTEQEVAWIDYMGRYSYRCCRRS